MEKTGDVEAKANLQPPFYIKDIDSSKCPKSYCPLVKKDKEDANRENYKDASNKDKEKAKFYNPFFTNQPQAQASKKREKNQWGSPPAPGINATEVAKKDKDKAKDLSHVECYTCKQKGHYANRCPKKLKN